MRSLQFGNPSADDGLPTRADRDLRCQQISSKIVFRGFAITQCRPGRTHLINLEGRCSTIELHPQSPAVFLFSSAAASWSCYSRQTAAASRRVMNSRGFAATEATGFSRPYRMACGSRPSPLRTIVGLANAEIIWHPGLTFVPGIAQL